MSELGRLLKEQRERLNLSLSEASLSTKISARMLAAIEEGNYKVLPALPFAKGFVRSYASYLKLDADQMVTLYLSEVGELHESEPEVPEAEKVESTSSVDINDDSGGLTRFFIIGGVIALIAAIVGVKSIVDKYKREADLSHQAEVSVSPIEKESPEPVTEEEVSEVDVEPAEAPKEEASASEPAPAPAPEQQPEVTPTPPPASQETEVAETPQEEEAAPEKRQMEVLLEALDRVQVNVSIAGENKKVSLNAGEVHVLRTDEKVQLDISDGGALNLVVNGRSRGVPGSLGQRKKIQLP